MKEINKNLNVLYKKREQLENKNKVISEQLNEVKIKYIKKQENKMKEINKNLKVLYKKREQLENKNKIISEQLNEIYEDINKLEKAQKDIEKYQQKIENIMNNLIDKPIKSEKSEDVKSQDL